MSTASTLPAEQIDAQAKSKTSAASFRSPTPKAAKLQPKEHGAYAILGIPIATSLLIASPTISGCCIAVAAIAGFLAHEPLLIASGKRGKRAKQNTPHATNRLAILLSIVIASGLTAVATGTTSVRIALFGCGLLAAGFFGLTILDIERQASSGGVALSRTFGGQLGGVIGLSVPCLPILLAGGFGVWHSIAVWSVWLVGFFSTTIAVRGVIAAQKRKSRVVHWTSVIALSLTTAVWVAIGHPFVISVVPMLLMSCYLLVDPPPAKYIKRVGWALVAGTMVSAVWLSILAMRFGDI
ncbi:YwiC-like family protein [Rhodopirellula sallentina]|uniref:Membrane protein n=1 Tax=Rhodopirellula sallentina SM41 TaxID=1263870 RepID=M5UKS0_9BACT|nr:YwiC-like family protein [Rhodopirellula sallentina]EMI58456.1 membrane protein [Rhodopirellula sallentina SM41]